MIPEKADENCTVHAGTSIAGFGRGVWKPHDDANTVSGNQVLFQLSGQDDLVEFENKLVTIGKIIDQKSKDEPSAGIAHHKMVRGTLARKFKLELKHMVVFHPSASEDEDLLLPLSW